MEKIKVNSDEIQRLFKMPAYEFPKYTTQLINLINRNAGGTRPQVVGQMSDLIQQFDGETLEEWVEWYTQQQPDAIKNATDKIFDMYQAMSEAFASINRTMIEEWVKDLVYNKTYAGLKVQSAVLTILANRFGKTGRLATKEEEAKGIDGFLNDKPIQIKASTYKLESQLIESFVAPIVYYEKVSGGIIIEYDPADFQ
ncbi:MAG: MjaI family restriction endonuclease [Muribaculaceae bacterium]